MDFEALEKVLKCNLPPDLRRKLTTRRDNLEFRWLTLDEAGAILEMQAAGEGPETPTNCRLLWTDDESNFAGVYIAGPMQGRCFISDHDGGLDVTPLYRSGSSFLDALVRPDAPVISPWKFPVDYPNQGTEQVRITALSETERDWQIAEELLRESAVNFDGEHLCLCAMVLMPKTHAEEITVFLRSPNDRLRAKACRILGFHRFEPALPVIADHARNPNVNLNVSAMIGLGLMKTEASLKALLAAAVENEISRTAAPSALRVWGAEIQQQGRKWTYRLPDSNEWYSL